MGLRPRIAVIRGDGVGPEVIDATLSLLERVVDAEFVEVRAGKAYFNETGLPMEEGGMDKLRESDALLKGPIATPTKGRSYPSVNLRIRREFDLYANIRPFKSYDGISLRRMDLVMVRENVEGLYSGEEELRGDVAVTRRVITRRGARRIAEFAFRLAEREGRAKVTAIHKKNVLKVSDGLFLEEFYHVASKHPSVEADDYIVDAAAYRLVKVDRPFDVMLLPNLYGDILSDVAAGVIGSLGLCGSAQIGDEYAAFEPIHGTAEDIAGRGIANPLGTILAASMMLEWLGIKYREGRLDDIGRKMREAVERAVKDGVLTPDLGGNATTFEVAEAVLERM